MIMSTMAGMVPAMTVNHTPSHLDILAKERLLYLPRKLFLPRKEKNMLTLTECKGRHKKQFTFESSDNRALRILVSAVNTREGYADDSTSISCGVIRDEGWCRRIADGIKDYLRLDEEIQLTTTELKILKTAFEALENFGRPKKTTRAEFQELLEDLLDLDNLWERSPDSFKINGFNLDLGEVREAVLFLKEARGGVSFKGNY